MHTFSKFSCAYSYLYTLLFFVSYRGFPLSPYKAPSVICLSSVTLSLILKALRLHFPFRITWFIIQNRNTLCSNLGGQINLFFINLTFETYNRVTFWIWLTWTFHSFQSFIHWTSPVPYLCTLVNISLFFTPANGSSLHLSFEV